MLKCRPFFSPAGSTPSSLPVFSSPQGVPGPLRLLLFLPGDYQDTLLLGHVREKAGRQTAVPLLSPFLELGKRSSSSVFLPLPLSEGAKG